MGLVIRRIAAVVIGVALAAALVGAGLRMAAERANNSVAIVVDYYAVRQLALMSDRSLDSTLAALRAAGVWGVGLAELTVGQAAAEGLLQVLQGEEVRPTLRQVGLPDYPVRENSMYLVWAPGTTPQWLEDSLRLHIQPWVRIISNPGNLFIWEAPAAPPPPKNATANAPLTAATLSEQGLGLSPTAMAQIHNNGLAVVPRFTAQSTITAAAVRFRLTQLADPVLAEMAVVFTGDSVPGNPELTTIWAEHFRTHETALGLIEFARQPGDAALLAANGNKAVRVHAISEAELAKLDIETVLARWRRAVRERDIRMLYARPLPPDHPALGATGNAEAFRPALWESNLSYIERVAAAVKEEGMALGPAAPYRSFAVALPWLLIMTAGAAAAAWLLAAYFITLPAWSGLLVIAGGPACVALAYLAGQTALSRQLPALAAALVFPVLGVFSIAPIWRRRSADELRRPNALPGGVIGAYFLISAVALAGALLVVGMLADVRFLIKIEQFAGVKLAHLFPPLLVALAALAAPLPISPISSAELKRRWQRFLNYPVAVKYLVVAALVGMGGLVYLLRTGNAGLPISGLEQQAREWLEQVLIARPRTKEILFGHPLLVAALDQVRRGRVSISRWLLAGAVIGQLSMINTFSHIHTPLLISVLRTVSGLMIGLIVGWFIARPLVEWCVRKCGK